MTHPEDRHDELSGSGSQHADPQVERGEVEHLDGERYEDEVRALLRSVADTGPMPDDVAARLDEALAQARGASPVGSLSARRRRRVQRAFAAAAGIAVLGVAGSLAVTSGDQPADRSATGVAAEELPADTKLLESGKDYVDVAAVQDVGADAVEETVDGAAADSAQSGDSGLSMLDAPVETPSPSATTAEDKRPVAERVAACTSALGVDPESVVAVEIASWRQVPAALVVHRTDAGAEVVVVALDCEPGDEAYSRVDVPLPPAAEVPEAPATAP